MAERIPITSTEDWLAERQRWINASEIATVCGVSSYGSLAELFAEKKGLRPPLIDNAIFRRGRWGEAAVFQALSEERPEWNIQRARVHVRDIERRMACTPDGFALAPDRDGIGIVQAKVISRSVFRQKWLDDSDDDYSSITDGDATPPAAYHLQTLTEMMLNDTRWGVLAVLINGEFDWTLRLFDVERDAAIEDSIFDCTATFWRDHLDANVMPPFEPQKDEKLIKALYPRDDGREIDLTGDNRALALVDEWIETSAARKRFKDSESAIKTELQGKLGDHTYGRLADGRRLSWKHQHRKAHAVPPADFRVLRLLTNTKD